MPSQHLPSAGSNPFRPLPPLCHAVLVLLIAAVPGVSGQLGTSYVLGTVGANACPSGSVHFADEAACVAAVGSDFTSSGGLNDNQFATASPKSCFVKTFGNGATYQFFNPHATGGAHGASTPVCEPESVSRVPTCTDTDSRQTDHYCSDAALVYNAAADATPNPSDAACCIPATCAVTDKYGRAGHPFDCPNGTSFVASNSDATSPNATQCCTAPPTVPVTAPDAITTEAAATTAAVTTAAAANPTEAAAATGAVSAAEANATKALTFTYSTVDCAVVSAATITSACVALTIQTTAQYPDMIVSSCSGACGSLVLQLQIDGSVADADIAAVEAAIAASPSSVAIALGTTDGATLNLSPSAVMFQGTAAQPTLVVTGKTGRKSKKGKTGRTKSKKGKKGSNNGAKTGKGKGKRAKSAKQSLAEATAKTTAARTQTHLVLLVGLLGVVGVAIGLRKSAAQEPGPAEPTEKSPLVAA